MTTLLKPECPKWLRVLLWSMMTLVALVIALVCGGALYFRWASFHPTDATPIVGPAGLKNRAFIDERGFVDVSLIVCASDWPHTFREPFALGDVYFPQTYSSAKIFWSADGSVLAFRVIHRGKTDEVYEAAYDFREHLPLEYCDDRIRTLIQSRGGLGPRFNEYSERKG